MFHTFILIVVLAAAVVVVLTGLVLRRRQDTLSEIASQRIELDPVLGAFLDALHHCSSETDDRYRRALARLRQDPEQAARQIEAAYRSVGPQDTWARHSLLLAARALAHRAMLPFLFEVARQPGSGTVQHEGGEAAENSMLKTMAVDGIDAIARSGDPAAADALLSLVPSSDRAVQAAAVVALKYAETHRDHYDRVRKALPPDRLYLLDLVRASVRDVPQIADPRRHLRSEPATMDSRPDPTSGARRNSGAPPDRARVPRPRGHQNG